MGDDGDVPQLHPISSRLLDQNLPPPKSCRVARLDFGTVEHFLLRLIPPASLPGSIGRSGIHDQCLLHRPRSGCTLVRCAMRTPAKLPS
jgi:hypothetical protein